MKKRAKQEIHFAVCINNKKYEAFLEVGKLYRIIPVGDDGVQRAQERVACIGRAGRPRRREPVGRLRCQLDRLEPRSDGSGACRSGIVQHRTRLFERRIRNVAYQEQRR